MRVLSSTQRDPKHEHKWGFWGDDPYLICGCGEIRDALNGSVVRKGKESL